MMFLLFSETISAIFETALIFLWGTVFSDKTKNSKYKLLIINLFICVGLMLCFLYIRNVFISISITFLACLLELYAMTKEIKNNILPAIYFCGLIAFSDMISLSILKFFTGSTFEQLRFSLGIRFIGSISSKFISLCVIRLLYSKFKKVYRYFSFRVVAHLMILPLISLFVINEIAILSDPFTIPKDLISIIIILGLMAANFFEFSFFQKEINYQYEKDKNILLENQIDQQRLQYEMLSKKNSEIRKIRHDLKNNLISLVGYLNTNKIELAKDYLNNQINGINSIGATVSTNYPAIDSILNYKIVEAKKNNIQISTKILINHLNIDEMDVCLLLGNSLDNAIEANQFVIGEKRFISLDLIEQDNVLMLLIQNSCSKKISKEILDNGTTKFDKVNHGFGLERIDKIVKKYNGYFDCTIANGVFIFRSGLMNI